MRILLHTILFLILAGAVIAPAAAQEAPDPVDDMWSPGVKQVDVEIKYPFFFNPDNMDNDEVNQELNRALAGPVDQLRDFAGWEEESSGASLYLDFAIMRHTDAFLSIAYNGSIMHFGTAHPVNPMFGVTVDLGTGRAYSLKDMFQPGCDVKKQLLAGLQKYTAANDAMLLGPIEDFEMDPDDPWVRPGFYLTDHVFVLFFQEYVFTPHVYGPLVAEIPYANLKGCLKDTFMPGAGE
jgi:hypothetical protein